MCNSKTSQPGSDERRGFLKKVPLPVWLAIFLAAGMASLCWYLTTPKTPKGYETRAIARMQRSEFQGAVRDFNAALGLFPTDWRDTPDVDEYQRCWVSCHAGLAAAHLGLRNNKEVIVHASMLLAADPHNGEMYLLRAIAYGQLREWRRALDDWDKRLELRPDDSIAISQRAGVRCELKDYAGALEDYGTLMRLQPSDLLPVYGSGFVHFMAGEYSKAISFFDRAIHIKRDYAKAYYMRGFAHYRLGHREEAEKDLQRAMSINPYRKNEPYTMEDTEKANPGNPIREEKAARNERQLRHSPPITPPSTANTAWRHRSRTAT